MILEQEASHETPNQKPIVIAQSYAHISHLRLHHQLRNRSDVEISPILEVVSKPVTPTICQRASMLAAAQQQIDAGAVPAAFHILQHVLTHFSTNANQIAPMELASLWYVIGKGYETGCSLGLASVVFSNILNQFPTASCASDIHFRLGKILRRKSKPELALWHFTQIVSCLPAGITRAALLFEIAQTHEAIGSFRSAKAAYNAIQPTAPKALARLALLYRTHPNSATQKKALAMLEELVSTDPRSTDGWLGLSRVQTMANQPAQAYTALMRALSCEPNSALLWCEMGALYMDNNQYPDAVRALERSLQLHPHVPETLCNIGMLHEMRGEFCAARDKYQAAHRISNNPVISGLVLHLKHVLDQPNNPQTQCRLQPLRIDLSNPLLHVRDLVPCPLFVSKNVPDFRIDMQ